ncbi:Aste57867_10484 [Aphanomyces stellatus]|uniref:Aste57867_10484 protein n=1 Tax=Aphanomyces stellatus TaxID=120398 RepID=A0A485KQH8_9STRA|nr:hypothetical protein As57867_010444 [Aphanomyces stellatus]VFT87358.1 Aste57867_10484 [Aphanomyces stellatus]
MDRSHVPPPMQHNPSSPPQYTSLEMKCRYAYKNCPNARTHKENGELHSLCEFHRDKANSVQKIYARKRRCRKRQERLAAKAAAAAAVAAGGNAITGKGKGKRVRKRNPPKLPTAALLKIDPIPYPHDAIGHVGAGGGNDDDEVKMEVDEIAPRPSSFTDADVEMLRDLM